MKYKTCTKCGKRKLANTDNFQKSRHGKYGLESECRNCRGKRKKYLYSINRDKILIGAFEYNQKLKFEVISHYGGRCVHCDEIIIPFLTQDHINNDGAEQRIGIKGNFYLWLIRNGFPPNFQILCWNCQHLKHLKFCKTKHKQTKNAIKYRFDYQNLRLKVISHYGGRCTCCGELNIDLLVMDHINGGGCKHRNEITSTSSSAYYEWLIKNNFPSGFQVLCHNCNEGKRINGGVCPHKDKI